MFFFTDCEETEADKFIRESNINIIEDCLAENPDDPRNQEEEEPVIELGLYFCILYKNI